MEEAGLPHTLFEIGYEPSGRKRIHNYFNLRWLETIKAALDEEHLEMLAASQFSQVLRMGNHTFSVMFVHYLLSRQLVTDKEFELWWVFAGKPIRYALADFAVVTGLNCGKADKPKLRGKHGQRKGKAKELKSEGKVWKQLFRKWEKPTPIFIMERLLLGKKYKDAETRFRLALLLLVEGVLCPTCGATNIRPHVVEMLDVIESFLQYPWGRESFLLTVRSTKARTPSQFVQDTTAIQGFTHAMVLVTVTCCPFLVAEPGRGDVILDEGMKVEDIAHIIADRALVKNIATARGVDIIGQAPVRSILNDRGGIGVTGLHLMEEDGDVHVDHMVTLINEGFPFEHNSWRGGVKAEDVVIRKSSACHNEENVDIGVGLQASVLPLEEEQCSDMAAGNICWLDNGNSKNGDHSGLGDDVSAGLCVVANRFEERALALYSGFADSVTQYLKEWIGKMKDEIRHAVVMAGNSSTIVVPDSDCWKLGDDSGGVKLDNGGTKDFLANRADNKGKEGRDVESLAADGLLEFIGNGSTPINSPSSGDEFQEEASDVRHGNVEGTAAVQSCARNQLLRKREITGMPSLEDDTPIGQIVIKKRRSVRQIAENFLGKKAKTDGGSRRVSILGSDGYPISPFIGTLFPFSTPTDAQMLSFWEKINIQRTYTLSYGVEVSHAELLRMFEGKDSLLYPAVATLAEYTHCRWKQAGQERFVFIPPPSGAELQSCYPSFLASYSRETFIFPTSITAFFQSTPTFFTDVEIVYTQMKLKSTHWVGLIFNIRRRTVEVVDCNTACISDEDIQRELLPIASMFPHIVSNFGGDGIRRDALSNPFSINRVDLSLLCEVPGLDAIASLILLELHSTAQLDKCGSIMECNIQTAAKNYAVECLRHLEMRLG